MRNAIFPLFNTLLFSLLALSSSQAATLVTLNHQSSPVLTSAPGTTLKTLSTYQDFNHQQHTRLQQMYQGYPVFGATLIKHSNGQLNGHLYNGLNAELPNKVLSTTLTTNVEAATIQSAEALYRRQHPNQQMTILKTKANRIVYLDKDNKAHWAYLVDMVVNTKGKLEEPIYILDENTKALYQSWNNLHTEETKLTAVEGGGFGGNSKIGIKAYDGLTRYASSFILQRDKNKGICYLKGSTEKLLGGVFFSVSNGSHMFDQNAEEPVLVQYDCKEKNAQHHGIYWNDDLAATNDNDAFYYANVANNMYMSWMKTPAIFRPGTPDKNGEADLLPIPIYTHLNMSNAAWIGALNAVFIGEGDDNEFASFASVDILAHELSHGFTEQNSNLIYNGQSGGLNESFSDMAGASASYFLTGQTNWKIGADITLTQDALRYMDNPRHDCVNVAPYVNIGGYKIRNCSIDNIKDYKDGNADVLGFQVAYTDPHFSSGIFNKAFYLIAQGFGGDKNEGTRKAFEIMVQANRGYWVANSTFEEAACGVLAATHDYGYDESVVKNAFYQVGLETSRC